MNKYALLYEPKMGLLDDWNTIEGKTGVEALESYLPDHMIGKVKRARWREIQAGDVDFMLHKYKEVDGYRVSAGRKVWYKYHHPKIERIGK